MRPDIERRQPDPLQPDRIEPHSDLALDVPDALDATDAAYALQRAYDHVLDEKRDLLRRLSGRYRGVGEDRKAGNVDALGHRLVDGAREIAANARDGVLDIVERTISVGSQPERDGGAGNPVGDLGDDVVGALDACDGVLNFLGDLRFELCGRRAELRYQDRNDRNVNVRHPRDRQLIEAEVAERHDRRGHDERRERLPDRPGRNIDRHQRPSVCPFEQLPGPSSSLAPSGS
jgi:hypothetical protein